MKKGIGKLLIELLIVFIGVYLAFQLNNYKEEKSNKNIKNNYYKVLLKDFNANLQDIQLAKKEIQSFISQIDSGKKPNPALIKKIDLTNNLFLIKSAFNSGYLENLESEYIKNISNGSNHLTRVAKLIDNYNNSVSATQIKYNFDKTLFYNSDNSLKEQYKWCKEDLEYIVGYLNGLEIGISKGAIPDTKALIK